MEEVKGEGEAAEQSSSNGAPAEEQPLFTSWCRGALRTTLRPWRGRWRSLVPAGVVWLVCQAEAPLHPSLSPSGVCWRLLLVGSLWMLLAACAHGLRCSLQPGRKQGDTPESIRREVVSENRSIPSPWVSQPRSPGLHVPLALALANSLLLCVLQEPLPDPSVPHILALLSRLESVSHALKADPGPEGTLDETGGDSVLTDKVKLISAYLEQRMRSLRTLVQLQGDFEASVTDTLTGLGGLWAQLEELHTGVTLTKEGGHGGHGDLASARADAEDLFVVVSRYRERLQRCQTQLTDGTRQLQELAWSHAHTRKLVSRSTESVWPELLLQSNIEQFDKVQEGFLSLQQQTSTFQAHLEGLGKGDQGGRAGPLAHANVAESCPASPQTTAHLVNGRPCPVPPERCDSTSASASASSMDTDAQEAVAPLSLRERSALRFSSTLGRLRKPGRRK